MSGQVMPIGQWRNLRLMADGGQELSNGVKEFYCSQLNTCSTPLSIKNNLIGLNMTMVNVGTNSFLVNLNNTLVGQNSPNTRGSLRFVKGRHQDSVPRHMGEHVLNKYICVESPGLQTIGQIRAHRRSACPVPSS